MIDNFVNAPCVVAMWQPMFAAYTLMAEVPRPAMMMMMRRLPRLLQLKAEMVPGTQTPSNQCFCHPCSRQCSACRCG